MQHDGLTAVGRRLAHGGDQGSRAACGGDRLIEQTHGLLRAALGAGMGIEHHGIAGGDHADGIIDHGGCRVGGRGDGSYHTKWRPLLQHHPLIARMRGGDQVLNAGCTAGNQQIFLHLVLHVPIARLLMSHSRQMLGVLHGSFAHGADQLTALFECEGGQLCLRCLGGPHSLISRVPQPAILRWLDRRPAFFLIVDPGADT